MVLVTQDVVETETLHHSVVIAVLLEDTVLTVVKDVQVVLEEMVQVVT